MIGTWILILVLSGSHGGGVTTQEFHNQEKCEAAGNAAKSLSGFSNVVRFSCVLK